MTPDSTLAVTKHLSKGWGPPLRPAHSNVLRIPQAEKMLALRGGDVALRPPRLLGSLMVNVSLREGVTP